MMNRPRIPMRSTLMHQRPISPLRYSIALVACALALTITGCPPPPPPVQNVGPVQRIETTVNIINGNRDRLPRALKATGRVSGEIKDASGQLRRFDPDAFLQVLVPTRGESVDKVAYFLFTLKILGQTELLAGSNAKDCWLYIRQDNDRYLHGSPEAFEEIRLTNIALRPSDLLDAMGLNRLPEPGTSPAGPFQRIDTDYQQLLMIEGGSSEHRQINREYWVERRSPYLLRKVIFRDRDGRAETEVSLNDYRIVENSGGSLPHEILFQWPADNSWLRFKVSKWAERAELNPSHPALIAPHKRNPDAYPNSIDIDREMAARGIRPGNAYAPPASGAPVTAPPPDADAPEPNVPTQPPQPLR